MSNHPNRIWKFLPQQKPENSGDGDGNGNYPFPQPLPPAQPLPPIQPLPPGMPPWMLEPSDPQLQSAPPEAPPFMSDEGGDGDGDGGEGWQFPVVPPMGRMQIENPFVVRHVTTANVEHPMYAVATMPFYGQGVPAECHRPGYPPPIVIAFWVFPIQYIEVQARQYFRPPGPFVPMPLGAGDVPDHDEAAYRALGWLANPIVTERCPVFHCGPSGDTVNFNARFLDTPYSDWHLVTVDRNLQSAESLVTAAVSTSRRVWLNPIWLTAMPLLYQPFTQLPALYERAYEHGAKVVCATAGWEWGGWP